MQKKIIRYTRNEEIKQKITMKSYKIITLSKKKIERKNSHFM